MNPPFAGACLQAIPFRRSGGFPTAALSLSAILLASVATAADAKKVTYEDDVLPIFRDNCLKCHNPDKLKGDLDLTSFSAVVKGGGSGATLNAGDPDGSLLFKSITHAEEPEMPPKSKLSDKEIATIRQWIAGGMLQGANSKALAANKPTVDLALKAGAIGKPDGPPPMPGPLSLEPFVRATRGSALAALAASPWAPVVALAGPHQISLYHTGDLEFLGVLPFPEGLPCDVKFSRNGKLLLAGGGRGGHSGLVAVWDIAKAERVITIGDQFDSVLAADISSDQQWIALGGPDRILKIYQTKDGALAHRLKKHTEWVTAVEFSPDSKYLATGDRNGGLVLWEAASGQEMFNLPGHRGAITAITWRSDSELVASSSEDGTLKLWKAADGSALRSINANPGGCLSARFTHDGRIVTCGRDNKLQSWDVSGKNLLNLAFTGDLPNRVTFTDDGKKVIASDWQGKVTVWDAKTGKPVGELESYPLPVAERVQQAARKVADLKAELAKAAAAQAKAATDALTAQAAHTRAKTALAETKNRLAAAQAQEKQATHALALEPANADQKQRLAAVSTDLADLKPRSAALQKEFTLAAQQIAATTKKAAEAKSLHESTEAKLTAAIAAHAKWQAVPLAPKSATGKLSALDRSLR
jgi:mono/diheme cytochrome c family protein